jgi:Domain of unknown function (DUF4062)
MDVRYHVFVSSTHADLQETRREVGQTLLKMNCMPTFIENPPASDEAHCTFVRRIIDECDYYLLIIGERNSPTAMEGVSFAEIEYDHAIKRGLKVIALLHTSPEDPPPSRSDPDAADRERLAAFCERVEQEQSVEFWKAPEELPGKVALCLLDAIRLFPAVGWIEANRGAQEEVLSELYMLRKERDRLQAELTALKDISDPIRDLAGIKDSYKIVGTAIAFGGSKRKPTERTVDWQTIWGWVAPRVAAAPHRSAIRNLIAERALGVNGREPHLDDQCFDTIEAQMQALGLVEIQARKSNASTIEACWILTPRGRRRSIETLAIRSKR